MASPSESAVKPASPAGTSANAAPAEEPEGYFVPKRHVFAIFDMAKWYRSEAYDKYLNFLHRINDSVIGVSNNANVEISDRVKSVIKLIDTLSSWTSDFPPVDMQEQRFGNKAYRLWHTRLTEQATDLIKDLLPEEHKAAVVELRPYLLDSFGNATRIDYGSGHEAAFLFFLLCCYETNVLIAPDDDQATVLRLFAHYLRFCRKLQTTYRMEPAGSRGVHAIDDYQFVPFIFGSAQLIGNKKRLIPDSYLNANTVEANRDDNLFFEAIQYINETKYGPFYEHSNQLYNISSVAKWEKVNSGMFKMYEGECLKKFPVAQHFVFGSILSIKQRPRFELEAAAVREAAIAHEKAEKEKAEQAEKEKHPITANVDHMNAIAEDVEASQ
uniref:Serine/threonine-protein phosphatase 2A activator n=1 Tax=Panagrellus redivivus TaxID=6233 RepID=A0A7E4V453_PANRE